MGAFFAGQMALILLDQPWWLGTLSGVATATIVMALLNARNRRRKRASSRPPALDGVQTPVNN